MAFTQKQIEKQKEGPAHFTSRASRTFNCAVTNQKKDYGWNDNPNSPHPAIQLEECPFCGAKLGTDNLIDINKLSPHWKDK